MLRLRNLYVYIVFNLFILVQVLCGSFGSTHNSNINNNNDNINNNNNIINSPSYYSSPNILNSLKISIVNTYQDVLDEIKYRKLSLSQYRDQISTKVQRTMEKFRKERIDETSLAVKDFNNRVIQLQDLYREAMKSLEKQKLDLIEINKVIKFYDDNRRQSRLDESLDQFRKFYNETFENLIKSPLGSSVGLDKFMKSIDDDSQSTTTTVPSTATTTTTTTTSPFDISGILEDTSDLFSNVIRRKEAYDLLLQQNLVKSWETVLKTTLESSRLAELNAKSVIAEFSRLQDEFTNRIKSITNSTQSSIKHQIMKSGVRMEGKLLEDRLKRLEMEWLNSPVGQAVDIQRKQMEVLIRNLQERIQLTNSTYDGLISKRRNTMYHSYMNDVTLNKVLKLIDPTDKGWTKIRSENNIDVYRKFMDGIPGSQYACVRCSAVINSSLSNVWALFDDDTRIREYNSFYAMGKDIEYLTEDTRVVWSASPPVLLFKPRDFCTVIHSRKLKDGTVVILNRAINHPLAPPSSTYVRAAIILGANIIQPIPNHPSKCRLTMITQVDPGGFTPPMIVNHVGSSYLFPSFL